MHILHMTIEQMLIHILIISLKLIYLEVMNITKLRDRLSPKTKMDIDELGVILGGDNASGCLENPSDVYYNAAGGLLGILCIKIESLLWY